MSEISYRLATTEDMDAMVKLREAFLAEVPATETKNALREAVRLVFDGGVHLHP